MRTTAPPTPSSRARERRTSGDESNAMRPPRPADSRRNGSASSSGGTPSPAGSSSAASATPSHDPRSRGPGRQRINQNELSQREKSHITSPCAPDRMNSCIACRLRQTVIVQNSRGPAIRLAARTSPSVCASWRRTRSVARSMIGKKRTPRSRERVVTATSDERRAVSKSVRPRRPVISGARSAEPRALNDGTASGA
jgi:hypothetical protein